jgi:hypothetical protein
MPLPLGRLEMASSTPSKARLHNVLVALAALGHQPVRIVVGTDGGFSVDILRDGIGGTADNDDASPPRWPGAAE